MDYRISLSGLEEVHKMLKQLPGDLRKKYGKQGMQDGAEIVAMAVRGGIPSATGLARESIGATNVKMYEESGTLFCAIEPRKGYKRIVTANEALGFAGNIRRRIHGKKATRVTADFGRVQDPRKYMHLIESGRKAVAAKPGKAMHSALDVENRFFRHATSVAPHPVFGPAATSVSDAVRVSIENQLERGIQQFNRQGV